MKTISIQEIIVALGEKRKLILSTDVSDNFLNLLKQKDHWTIQEYKELSLAYDLKYMVSSIMDCVALIPIKKKYGFKLDWEDYFNVKLYLIFSIRVSL